MLKKISLWDFNFISAKSYQIVIHNIINKKDIWRNKRYPILITPNSDQIVNFNRKIYSGLKERLKNSYLVLPDGQPIIWLSRLIKNPIHKRLTGSDFFPLIWKEVKEMKLHALFIVANERIGESLKNESDFLDYYVAPHIQLDGNLQIINGESFINELVELIETNKPELIFVGIGFPKQEILTLNILDKLVARNFKPLPFFMLLGASFEFYLNLKKRAPNWMIKMGLEWLFRLSQEPRRLWKRYLISNFYFIYLSLGIIINKLSDNKKKNL